MVPLFVEMAEVVISIVAKVSEYLVAPAIRTGSYLFCVGKPTRKLEKEKRKLTLAKDDVSQHAEEAKRKTERIETVVEEWLQEVNSLLQDVENMEKEVRANSCFWNMCPTWRRYNLCKQLSKKIDRMIELNNSSKFEKFSHLDSLPTNIEYFSSPNFMLFESTKLAYDQLLEAIEDDGCYMICLHGMGGCGKTTLAKEVGRRTKDLNLFDKVVFTTVSQTLEVRRVQGEIADELGLGPLKEESEAGRAKRLSLGLRSGERILVILDDVWSVLNLEDIGIPLNSNLKGCKVLLTTRLQQLCSLMDGQRNVPLNLLAEEEAWALFQKKACITDDSSLLTTMARKVAAECKGLPIAIQAMATTLKGKPLDSWKDALYKLSHSKPVGVPEGVVDAFTCLQYSYDALKSEEAKSLFLMCSIFPEDHEIESEDLFRYGVGLSLFEDFGSFDDLRSAVNAALTVLLDYSLLMHSDRDENCFKMHDVVRDFALWVASKINRTSMVVHGEEMTQYRVKKNCFAIWYNRHDDPFPQQLDAPKLEILLLNSGSDFNLSHASFEGIERLRVMALINVFSIFQKICVSLPQSTQWLTNLRTLRLVECDLGDISFVVYLKGLEILDLHGSLFELLPRGIGKLTNLKLLDLADCVNIENFYEVIGMCSQLEELYVYNVRLFGGNISYSPPCFLEGVSFSKLQRYILEMGEINEDSYLLGQGNRVLHLGKLNISTLSTFARDLIQRAEGVQLEELQGGCKSIFPDFVGAVGSMNHLINFHLYSCSEIEFFIYSIPSQAYSFRVDMVFPELVELRLRDMKILKQVCHGECNLCNLKKLEISHCPMLTSLFSMQVAQTLSQLEDLTIEDCRELEFIIFNDKEDGANSRAKGHVPENSPLAFPKLIHLSVSDCNKLEYVFPVDCVQGLVQLQEIRIVNAPQMKYVFGKDIAENISTNENEIKIVFPELIELCLINLGSLVKICSANCYPSWPSLKKIWWSGCPKLTNKGIHGVETARCERSNKVHDIVDSGEVDVFHLQGVGQRNDNQEPITLELEQVELIDLPELSTIWKGFSFTQVRSLKYLQSIKLHRCRKLECVFPSVIHSSFPHLTDLIIADCGELEKIFSENEGLRSVSTDQVCFPKLTKLKIWGCTKLKVICTIKMARSFPHLQTLCISEALELKEIFRSTNEDIFDNEKEIVVPNLREIKLERLPSLINICHGFSFVTVKLRKVHIYDCPKFVEISDAARYWRIKGVRIAMVMNGSPLGNNENLTLPLTYLWSKDLDICGVIDILQIDGSVSVGGDHQHQVMDSQVVRLGSEHEIWRGPILRKMLSLHYLHTLTVRRCGRLKFLLPTDVIHESLPELAFLTISDCEELEQIIAEDKRGEHQNVCNNIAESRCFPKLRELVVERCNKLKRLFPATTGRELPQLQVWRISEAAELEELFGRKSEGSIRNDGEKILVPNLKVLELVHLPRLLGLRDELIIQKRIELRVYECPNLGF